MFIKKKKWQNLLLENKRLKEELEIYEELYDIKKIFMKEEKDENYGQKKRTKNIK